MTKIKICGLRRQEDVTYVNECLPDYAGFVFAKSRRQVTKEQVRELKKNLHPAITAVGVFVNEPAANVAELLNKEVIQIAQLHGDEDEVYIQELRTRMQRGKLMKAIRVTKRQDITQAEMLPVDYLLYDAFSGNEYGGTGKVFDWSLLSEVERPYFLAGGINIDNVEEAVRRWQPYAIDLSSAVETDGWKDREKIIAIVEKIKKINT
ncbi:MAG: phosphoribosylanthranilate isomerase [Lachnospiraceae bacterium]|nr:phosphoribosylanthranilate isomerase [Lachnospiraceae bacterium]